MNCNLKQIDIENPIHVEALGRVADWSAECSSMRSYTLEELVRQPLGIAGFDNEELLGYVALTEISEISGHRFARIGALTVAHAAQGAGLAGDLIKSLVDSATDIVPALDNFYAFVHGRSLKPFLDNGAVIIGARMPAADTGCNTIVSIDNQGVNNNENH